MLLDGSIFMETLQLSGMMKFLTNSVSDLSAFCLFLVFLLLFSCSLSLSLPPLSCSSYSIFPSFLIHFLYITALPPSFVHFPLPLSRLLVQYDASSLLVFTPSQIIFLVVVSGYVILSCCFSFLCTAHKEVILTSSLLWRKEKF